MDYMNNKFEYAFSPTYPCKTIANFLYNIYGIELYDEIKNIVFRLKRIETPEDKLIYDLNILFQNHLSCFKEM